jgi:uncharacterized protein YndB with AHSA1/START domain
MTAVTADGASVEVEFVVDTEPARMWDLVTDVARIGEWSPECVGASWLDGAAAAPGARFEGRNDYGNGFTATVTCVVTAAARPSVFEWVVLDPSELPERPGSIWRYELEADGAGQTRVVHRFVHGPGVTGLSEGMQADPARAGQVLQGRLDTLRKHMTITLQGMAAAAHG